MSVIVKINIYYCSSVFVFADLAVASSMYVQVRIEADKKDTEEARVVSEAAEALIRFNLSLMVYSDLQTCDALCVMEDYFAEAHKESVFCGIYSSHCDSLREIVHANVTVEDNPKLVKLYELLFRRYSAEDAKGICHNRRDFDD